MNRLSGSMSWNEPAQDEPVQDGCESSTSTQKTPECLTSWPIGTVSNVAKSFVLPLRYEPNYRYPLIIWLHSSGHNERQVQQVLPHVSLQNYIAVGIRGNRSADAAGHRFEWANSDGAVAQTQEHVADAIDEAVERFSVHSDRIVIAGYRAGGEMALQLAMRDPDRFAAVVSLGGALRSSGANLANLVALRKRRLPMLWQWACEGTHFSSTKLTEDIRTAMMIQAIVDVRQYVDDDEMTDLALRDVNAWIMQRVVAGDLQSDVQPWESAEIGFSAN